MTKLLGSLFAALYWPVIGFFALALIVYVIAFLSTIERSAAGSYYNTTSLKTIVCLVALLGGSVYMKHHGRTQLAHLILFGPFGLVLVTVVLFLLMAYAFGK